MNTKVISIKPEYVRILLFLYPEYTFADTTQVVRSKFIMIKDIRSRAERNNLEYYNNDCVVVSTQLYDEVWDEEVLKSKVIEFARVHYKSKKRTLNTIATEGDQFVDELIHFMYGLSSEEESDEVLELFNLYGSKAFAEKFIKVCEQRSLPQVRASMLTFITKVLQDTNSVFYKKKQMMYGSKLKTNFIKAYDSYIQRPKDDTGLSFLKFLQDLLR